MTQLNKFVTNLNLQLTVQTMRGFTKIYYFVMKNLAIYYRVWDCLAGQILMQDIATCNRYLLLRSFRAPNSRMGKKSYFIFHSVFLPNSPKSCR